MFFQKNIITENQKYLNIKGFFILFLLENFRKRGKTIFPGNLIFFRGKKLCKIFMIEFEVSVITFGK